MCHPASMVEAYHQKGEALPYVSVNNSRRRMVFSGLSALVRLYLDYKIS